MELRHWLLYGNVEDNNNLVEWKAFVDTVRSKSADLKATDCHKLLGMIGEIEVVRDRFCRVFVVFLYVTKVFSESTDARNVSFRISLRWPIHMINPVDKTRI